MFLPIQAAAVAALTGDQDCVYDTMKAYEARRDILCDGLPFYWLGNGPPGGNYVRMGSDPEAV